MSTITRGPQQRSMPSMGRGDALFGALAVLIVVLAAFARLVGILG